MVRNKRSLRRSRKRRTKRRKLRMRGGSKRLLLIIRGEVFRHGDAYSRKDGMGEAFKDQEAASKTHMDLVRKIESQGYTVDILLNTYHTDFDEKAKEFYGKNLKEAKFHTEKFENQLGMMKDCVDSYRAMNTDYDVILILRTDMFLKEQFINDYKADTPTVQFLGIIWTKTGFQRSPRGTLLINDVYFHFPKKFYDKLDKLYYLHESWTPTMHKFLEYAPLKFGTEYSLMSKHFYDSNTSEDMNPYYRFIGRPEATTWHDEGKDISQLPEFKGLV